MAVLIGSARIDERGRASGGKAGDQTGREVSTQNWYKHSKGWVVLRATDAEKAQKIAQAMRAACDNKNVGYDQSQNKTLVYAAEQMYGAGRGAEKLDYVIKQMEARGYTADRDEIEAALIELAAMIAGGE